MSPIYLLWHTQHQGWVSRAGGTTTLMNDAQEFDRSVAVSRATSSKDHQGNLLYLPVMKDDLR